MSRAISKKLFSNVTKTADPIFDKGSSTLPQEETTSSFFFISDYMYGGCLTFTAHLLHALNRKDIFRIAKRFEKRKKRNLGYGISYQNVPLEYLDSVQNVFITDMFQHFECLEKLKKTKNPAKIYGWANKEYVSQKLDSIEFSKYYQGKYVKSFDAISKILRKAKLMVDLSFLPNDGGGTQYTFLDAIYHDCAIILNRQWIENVDAKYRDFKEGENCYAVSNAEELKELLDDAENIDTTKVVQNARKLLDRHTINASDWYEESYPCSVSESLSN